MQFTRPAGRLAELGSLGHFTRHMDFKRTARRAILVTGFIATVAVAILTTPSVATQLAVFVTAVLVSTVFLLILRFSRWFRTASSTQQAERIWFASGTTSFIVWAVYWIPMIVKK